MKHLTFFIIVLFSALHARAADTVKVDLNKEYQTIIGNGINFEGYHRTGGSEVLASKFTTMLNNINSHLLRLGMPLEEWEPTNDDVNSDNFNWSSFRNTSAVTNSFKRLQQLNADGYQLWLAIWDVADWNVKNPSDGSARRIKNIDEFVESLTAYLLKVKEDYGVEPAYVSVNEPSIAAENGWGGYQIALTAEEQAEIILKAGARFEALGLSTKWLIALHKVYTSELEQAKRIYETPGVIDYIAGFDFHGYWWQSGHDAELAAWGDWTSSTGLPNFAGECDYDNEFWKRESSDKALWVHAEETALLLYKMYNVARAEGTLLWYGDSPTSSLPYRYANKHFYEYMTPESIVLDAASSSVSVLPTAFKHVQNDKFALILQNTANASRSVTLTGLPNKSMTQIESKDGSYYQTIHSDLQPENGDLTVTLAANSITTIHGAGGGTPTATFSLNPQIGLPPLEVTFDASASFDPQGTDISLYLWDFGDGEQEGTPNPITTHTYTTSGTYDVRLQIVNAEGETARASERVFVSGKAEIRSTSDAPMHPSFESPSEGIWAKAPVNYLSQHTGGDITDSTDYSAQFRMLYTESATYVRIDVIDDMIAPIDNGERVVLCFDFGNDKTNAVDDNDLVIYTPLDVQYMISMAMPVEATSEIRADGYTWEFRILNTYAGFPPQDGKLIGLEIFAIDFDNENEWGQLSWNGSRDERDLHPETWGIGQFVLDADNPPNQPPTVNISAPASQAIFNADESIQLSAEANDDDGSVSEVYFYLTSVNSRLRDDDASDGWSINWTPEETGAYTLMAIALDDDYEATESELVRFFVYENGQPDILFLVNDPNDLGNDAILKKRFEERHGLKVTVRSGESASMSDAEGKSLIFISESIGTRDSEATFKDAKIPIICCEAYIYDDLGMTGPAVRTDYGRERSDFITLQNHTHPLAANVLSDAITIAGASGSLSFGVPNNNADVVATVAETDKPAIFAYDRGDAMVNGSAPAARVGLFVSDAIIPDLTSFGWAFVDAAIQWAIKQPTAVFEKLDEQMKPDVFLLKQNYPNPFNPTTHLEYHLAHKAHVTLDIYNALGQRIRRLIDANQDGGVYFVFWDAENDAKQKVAAGIYLAKVEMQSQEIHFVDIKKMVLMK